MGDQIKPLQTSTEPEIKTKQYEYITLQGVFGDLLSHETIETISQITCNNEQQNYWSTLDFIANKAKKDEAINDYILMQYSLRVKLKKFGEGGQKATMKELQ